MSETFPQKFADGFYTAGMARDTALALARARYVTEIANIEADFARALAEAQDAETKPTETKP